MSGSALVWAANVKGLTPSEKIVLIQLSERHNKDTGRCDPRVSRLVDDCEMSRSTVMRHLKALEEKGLLSRVKRGNENGGRTSSQYDLHMGYSPENETGGKVPKSGRGKVPSGGGLSPIPDKVKSHQSDPLYIDKPVKNPKEPDQVTVLAEVLSLETAEAFVASRKAMKKPMTPFAAKLMRDRLLEMPNAEHEAKRAIRNGWQDVYPETKPRGQQTEDKSSKMNRWHKLASN